MIALPYTVLVTVVYAVVRRRWAGLPMPAETGRLLDVAWRRRGRIVSSCEDDSSAGAFWFGLVDRVVPLRADSIPVLITVCHIVVSFLVYGTTCRIGDSRSALLAATCYMVVTVMPLSRSYISLPAAPLSALIASVSFFVSLVFPASLIPYAVLLAITVFAVTATNSRRIFNKSAIRTAYSATGPFFGISAPFWALTIAGMAVGGFDGAVIVCVSTLTAAVAAAVLVPAGLLIVLPLASPFAGIAVDRIMFGSETYAGLGIVVVWMIACLYALIVQAKHGRDGGTFDDVAGRNCGEYIDRHTPSGTTVMNATGLSSLFLYVTRAQAVGRSAWLGSGTLPTVSGDTPPEVILTDETACSILSIDETEGFGLGKVFDGRIAMFARPGVIQSSPAAQSVLGIVVVTHNRADLTDRCLRSIERTIDVPYELVIVDCASTDSTSDLFEKLDSGHIFMLNDNSGFAVAVNTGVDVIEGDAPLLLLHNDVVLTENCVTRMMDIMDSTDADAVGPMTNVARPPQHVRCNHFRHVMELESFAAARGRAYAGRTQNTDSLGGFCMLVRKQTFESVGGFDEDFGDVMYGDADFCLRMAGRHARMAVARDAFVMHWGLAGWAQHMADPAEVFNRSIREFTARWNLAPELDMPEQLRAAGLRAQASALRKSGDLLDMLKVLVEAARIVPNDAALFNNIGAVLWTLDEHEKALKNFQRAVDLEPGLESAVANLTAVAHALDRTDDVSSQLVGAHRITNMGLDL